MREVERVVAVDWSGDRSAAGQRRKIWAGAWASARDPTHRGETALDGAPGRCDTVTLESGRTRVEVCEWLIEMARETPRMVVGVDFCFSYPAWFVEENGARTAPEFWKIVVEHGERWLAKECEDPRFWGKVGRFRTGKKPQEFCGDGGALKMLRCADEACKLRARIIDPEQAAKVKGIAPKSPFQIGGAGAVGTGTLRGIPRLEELHHAGFLVWPFEDSGLQAKQGRPLVVEIYPRLLTGEVNKSNGRARAEYLAKKQKDDAQYRRLNKDVMTKARGSEDAFDALVSVLAMVERRQSFLALRKTCDPVTLLEGAVWGAGE